MSAAVIGYTNEYLVLRFRLNIPFNWCNVKDFGSGLTQENRAMNDLTARVVAAWHMAHPRPASPLEV
ncbi:MAG: hypothetical protein UU47_C0003G0053 [candidate division TM6 bacterium GW2011_GWE2_41_16]|nr:MAG: hypothetical protein UU47_C0003G0053 [candidate division TM6 bacterium GW2011_GWE2_41_16]